MIVMGQVSTFECGVH